MKLQNSLLPSSILLLFMSTISSQALADDVIISSNEDGAILTSVRLGSGTGTLTINEDKKVTVNGPVGITVDGPHSLVINGSLINEATINATGIKFDSALTEIYGNLNLNNILDIGNTDEDSFDYNVTANLIGVEISGANGFTGNIITGDDALLSVLGADSTGIHLGSTMVGNIENNGEINMVGNRVIGIDIQGALKGNLVNKGDIKANSTGGIGIRVDGPITGAFVHSGSIRVGTQETLNENGDIVLVQSALAGIWIKNDITGGILFEGIGDNNTGQDDSPTRDSFIQSYGGAPAVIIENAKANGSNLVIGEVGSLGYGFIQRGNVLSNGVSLGVTGDGIHISGSNINEKTIISGGIHFDKSVLTVTASDAVSTSMTIGNWTETPKFLNTGSISSKTYESSSTATDGTTTKGPGADAFGLVIEANASLPTFENSGEITVEAGGVDKSAVAIIDLSGSLTQINNSGLIEALIKTAPGDPRNAIAFDLRANTTGISLINSGTIFGDILFGSGNDALTLNGGRLNGNVSFGKGTDTFTFNGEVSFGGDWDFDGSLHLNFFNTVVTLSSGQALTATSALLADNTVVNFFVDPISGENGYIDITNNLEILSTVKLQPIVTGLAVSQNSFILIKAGTINATNIQNNFILQDTPYLFNTSLAENITVDGTEYILNINLRTSQDLGFTGNLETFYNTIITNPQFDAGLDGALAGLTGQKEVEEALFTLFPTTSNVSAELELERMKIHNNNFSSRLQYFGSLAEYNGGFWTQERISSTRFTHNGVQSKGLLVDLALGYDKSINDNIAWGFSGTFHISGQNSQNYLGPTQSRFSLGLTGYGMFRAKGFYAGLDLGVALAKADRTRLIIVGAERRAAESSTLDIGLNATFEAGYDFKLGGLHIIPFSQVSTFKYGEGTYTENGAESANFKVKGRSISNTFGTYGLNIGYDISWIQNREKITFRPEVFASGTNRLSGDGQYHVEATFLSTGDSFTLDTDAFNSDYKSYGVRANIFSDRFRTFIEYKQDKKNNLKVHSAAINIQISF